MILDTRRHCPQLYIFPSLIRVRPPPSARRHHYTLVTMTILRICQWGSCTLTFASLGDLRSHVQFDHATSGRARVDPADFTFERREGQWFARPNEGVVLGGECCHLIQTVLHDCLTLSDSGELCALKRSTLR